MNAIATPRTVLDLIDEYNEKVANVEGAIEAYNRACTEIESAGVVMGTYAEPILRGRAYVHARDMQRNLLKSGWKAIYNRLNIDMIASANDKRLRELSTWRADQHCQRTVNDRLIARTHLQHR